MAQVKVKQGTKNSVNNNAGILNAGTLAVTTDTDELFVTHNDGTVHQLCNPVIDTNQIADLAVTKPKLSQDTYNWIDGKVDKAGDTMSGDLDMGGNDLVNAGFETFETLPTTFKGTQITFGGKVYTWNVTEGEYKCDNDYLEIGGRNLFKKSTTLSSGLAYGAQPTHNDVNGFTTQGDWTSDAIITVHNVFPSQGRYTVSGYYVNTYEDYRDLIIYIGDAQMGSVSSKDGIPMRFEIQVEVVSLEDDILKVWAVGGSGTHTIDFKVEKGNKATDWTPAPEDKADNDQSINYDLSAEPNETGTKTKTANTLWQNLFNHTNFLWAKVKDLFSVIPLSVNDGYVPKIDDVNKKLVKSNIYDNGTNVGIGTTAPTEKLDVDGNINLNGNQIKNVAIDVVTSLPATNIVGRQVTYEGRSYIWDGSAWKCDSTTVDGHHLNQDLNSWNSPTFDKINITTPTQNYNPFGGGKIYNSIDTNIVAGKWKRLTVTIDGVVSTTAPKDLTDLNGEKYSSAGLVGIQGGSAKVININFDNINGYYNPSGITYGDGFVTLISYYIARYASFSCRVRKLYGGIDWINIPLIQIGSTLRGEIPNLSYVTDIEFTLTPDAGTSGPYISGINDVFAITQFEYHASRMSIGQSAVVSSVGGYIGGMLHVDNLEIDNSGQINNLNANKLQGKLAADFATSTHNHDTTYLGVNDTAAVSYNSYALDGYALSDFPLLDNGKIQAIHLPDYLLGQVLFGGTIDFNLDCTITLNCQNKYGLPSVENIGGLNAPDYEGVYFIATDDIIIGSIAFEVGDWVISNGVSWIKIDNTDAVSSVNGQNGAVVITLANLNGQPLDADLTAIAGLAGTSGLLKKTAANTWGLDASTYFTDAVINDLSNNYIPKWDDTNNKFINSQIRDNGLGIGINTDPEAGFQMKVVGSSNGSIHATADILCDTTIYCNVLSALATSGSPLQVISTTKVANLNVDYLDGYHAGNANGNIPISNTTLNVGLNADLLDGKHATAFADVTHDHALARNISGEYGGFVTYNEWAEFSRTPDHCQIRLTEVFNISELTLESDITFTNGELDMDTDMYRDSGIIRLNPNRTYEISANVTTISSSDGNVRIILYNYTSNIILKQTILRCFSGDWSSQSISTLVKLTSAYMDIGIKIIKDSAWGSIEIQPDDYTWFYVHEIK